MGADGHGAGGPARRPPPYSQDGRGAGGAPEAREAREPLDCWACAVLVTAQNLLVGLFNLLLLLTVLAAVLLPALIMLGFGFLCHSQFLHAQVPPCTKHLRDPSFTALLVVGFILLVPLLVLALAGYRRLCRRLRLADCLVPYSHAVYRGLPSPRPRPLRPAALVPGPRATLDAPSAGKVWV
ncbi:transmembrane protein 88 [Ornithorhynchus anatinus]|nr:transmembrane protein 88 [Ornithorhynchus anatinus]